MITARRFEAALVTMMMCLTGCTSATHVPSPSGPSPCPTQPGGALCIHVLADHRSVRDVIGYASYGDDYLAGKTWRLVLSTYRCDPGTTQTPTCKPSATYPGPSRSGLPPASTYCRASNGATLTNAPGCHDTLAQNSAVDGDWPGFAGPSGSLPITFPTTTTVCLSEQVQAGGTAATWVDAATSPRRACSTVS